MKIVWPYLGSGEVGLDVAATEARAQALAEQLLKENLTKGFVRVDDLTREAAPGTSPAAAVYADGFEARTR